MDSVKVAVRIRPLVQSEIDNGCRSCIERIANESQVNVGKNNSFSFNFVFDENEGQAKVYNVAVQPLIENLFKGYNVTILAYGQTGSGKTFTMGTDYSGGGELGIIPRAIYEIFDKINSMNEEYSFGLSCSFMELYNECLYDLLTDRPREQSIVEMREATSGICIPGLTVVDVSSSEDILEKLKEGSHGRVVGATAMNSQSSRSHAVFTITIKILHKKDPKQAMTSKLQLVDLAGSERSKKTLATGDRFKEGININKGLMVLGNVISQLGEGQSRFINYRDSKLTRFLQDSLGGNSVTLMIACVSPADYNQDESLSTLRYADRAKKIKNKPVVNQDPTCAELARLRKENEELRLAIISDGTNFCPPSHKTLEETIEVMKRKHRELTTALQDTVAQNGLLLNSAVLYEKNEELFKEKIEEIQALNFDSMDLAEIRHTVKDKLKAVESELASTKQQRILAERQIHNDTDGPDVDGGNSEDDETCRHEHFMSQAKINREILLLNRQVMWKEELVAKLTETSQQLGEISNNASKESVDDLKNKIASVEKEKEELMQQIRSGLQMSSNNTAKVSEQRRKRLQELEQKVLELNKRIVEQEKIISMKKSSDEKINNLKNDIQAAKQLKVKLIQQMKAESEKFRSYKQEKDREAHLLRSQNMKNLNQIKKIEQMHSLKQNVLKRKLEAAAAANKRIRAVLDRQKVAAQFKRSRGGSGGISTDRIKEKLVEELEMVESAYQAEKSLESLIQDRAALTKQLAVIKKSLEDGEVPEEGKVKLAEDSQKINNELEMRSAEISDLQEKLLDIHRGSPDDFTRGNWDILTTMADAKFALTYLFNSVTEKIKDNLTKCHSLVEAKEQLADCELEISSLNKRIDAFQAAHHEAINRIEKETEEKIHVLLRKLNVPNLESEVESDSQAEELAKSSASGKENICDSKGEDATFAIPYVESKLGSKRKFGEANAIEKGGNEIDGATGSENDEDELGPLWVRTPISRRLKSLKARPKASGPISHLMCTCRHFCGALCPCKEQMSCNENCSCDPDLCSNKVRLDKGGETIDSSASQSISPKRPRLS